MNLEERLERRHQTHIGIAGSAGAFLIWGLSPVYWKMLAGVPALEIIMHRIVWSFVFLVPLILFRGRRGEFTSVLTNRKSMGVLLGTSVFVAANWLIYIWAVNNGHVLQASLGYYINPLVNVVLGMVFLKERLRRPQALAVLLASAGVVYLGVSYGGFPWISISLALSFGFYGLVRKVAAVGALIGLAMETLLLSVPAVIYLVASRADGPGGLPASRRPDGFHAHGLGPGHGRAAPAVHDRHPAPESVDRWLFAVYCADRHVSLRGVCLRRAVLCRPDRHLLPHLACPGGLFRGCRGALPQMG